MPVTWMTKWGPRRLRVDVPTLEDALDAAEGLASDPVQQIEIAAGLLGLAVETVREDAGRLLKKRARRPETIQGNQSRGSVVVERKRPRRMLAAARV